jgi:uncharacterized protein
MQSVYEQIPQQYRNKIKLDFQRVWQTYDKNVIASNNVINDSISEKKAGQKPNEPLLELKKYVTSIGYSYSLSNVFSTGQSIRCYADRFYHTVINYNGKVYKCTAHMEQEAGILHDNGVIVWNERIMNDLYSKATFENERCLNCKHLPICLGPCSQHIKYNKCMMDNSEISCEQFIINVYNKKMNNETDTA